MGYGFSLQSLGIPLDNTGSGGISIGDSVGSSNANRLLYLDGSNQLSDSGLAVTDLPLGGGFLTIKGLSGVGSTNASFFGFDATGLGGNEVAGVAFRAGQAASFTIVNADTFANYFTVVKNSSDSVQMLAVTDNVIFADLTNANNFMEMTNAQINIYRELDMNSNPIIGVDDPTNAQDAATKNYVDTEIAAIGGSVIGELGKTTDGANNTSSGSSRKRVSVHTMTEDGANLSAFIRCYVSTGTQNVRALIYTDLAGEPGEILAVSDELVVSNTTAQWNEFTFPAAQRRFLQNGVAYWVGYINEANSNSFIITRENTASSNKQNSDTYSDGPSDPFGSNSTEAGIIDAYIAYGDPSFASASPGGPDTAVQYNNTGQFDGDIEFTRESDHVRIGGVSGNRFYDSTATDPLLVSLGGKFSIFHVSSYTAGSTENTFSSVVQAPNSPGSAYTGLYGRAQTGGGATTISGMTGFAGEAFAQNASGTITGMRAMTAGIANNGGGTVTSGIGLEIFGATNVGGGSIGTLYGLVIGSQNVGGTNYSLLAYDGLTVFNENGSTGSLRIEGDTDQNLFFADYDDDKIGIGTNTPASKLTVNGDIEALGDTNGLILESPDASRWRITVSDLGVLSVTSV